MEEFKQFFVTWDDRYCVGVKAIDNQHRYLIGLIRELQEAMALGSVGEALPEIVERLLAYARYHFDYEAHLLSRMGFAGAAEHQKAHSDLASRVVRLQEEVNSGRIRVGAPVLLFLKHWLADHILAEDQPAFAEAVRLASAEAAESTASTPSALRPLSK